ncbi:flapper [Glossina fuscipes fuscipes]
MKMLTTSGVHFIGSDGCHQKHKISWLAMLFITVAIICKHGSVSGVPAKLDPKIMELPEYIRNLNDPDIGGPVDYVPSPDAENLKIIAWDLLPPKDSEQYHTSESRIITKDNNPPKDIIATESINNYTTKAILSAGQSLSPVATLVSHVTGGKVETDNLSQKLKTTTPTNRPSTTTKSRLTTIANESTFLRLEAGDSSTLPSWLADIDDPDLDVAVPFIVPNDNNDYNHTVEREILPPLEPFIDLSTLHLPTNTETSNRSSSTTSFTSHVTTTKKPTTTTTRRPLMTTYHRHWVQTKNISTTKNPNTITTLKPFTNNHRSSTSEQHAAASSLIYTKSNINASQHSISTTIKPNKSTSNHLSNKNISHITSGTSTPSRPNSLLTVPNINSHVKDQESVSTDLSSKIEGNPFEPTIPPWLKGFDYPDVGPGVPYVYNPDEIDDDEEDDDDTSTFDSGSNTNFQSSSPSIATNPFAPNILPNAVTTKRTPFGFNPSIVIPTIEATLQPLDVRYESFPPYFNVTTSYDVPLIPTQTTIVKAGDEKFLRNNQLTTGTTSASIRKGETKYNSRFGGPPGILAPQGVASVTATATTKSFSSPNVATTKHHVTSDAHKFKGSFGGPPGVLAPFDDGKGAKSKSL